MHVPTLVDTLASYVPRFIVRVHRDSVEPPDAPHRDEFEAAVLFADISGFTRLAESLAQRGEAGTEELTGALNAAFGRLIDLVLDHGGDVFKFAGDALLVLWPLAPGERLAAAAACAARCALAMQTAMADLRAETDSGLALRVGIGAGTVCVLRLGGRDGRWECMVAGDPLREIGAVGHAGEPGEVVVAPGALPLLAAIAETRPVPGGGAILLDVRHEPEDAPAAGKTAHPPAPAGAEAALQAYLPDSIRARITLGHQGWLGEHRAVTVLFVNLPAFDHRADLDRAQAVLSAIQDVLFRYEGSFNKLSVDDKGVSLLAALGLPPQAHEDDAWRGAQAALELRDRLTGLSERFAIGVATGRAFCGEVGNAARREYTMIGDVVNLAARLMQASPGDILCDESTFQGARSRVACEILPPIALKGKAGEIPVFRPSGLAVAHARTHAAIVGRLAERQLWGERLADLAAGRSGTVVVEGEAGMGKSRLVAEFVAQARDRGIRTLVAAADPIERNTPYFAWRGVLAEALAPHIPDFDPSQRRTTVLARLEGDPEVIRLAPLLGAVLGLDFPDNDVTREMQGQIRAENTRDLVIRLLSREVGGAPLVVVVEDAHWLDSASAALVLALVRSLEPVLFVLAARPPAAPIPPEYARLVGLPGAARLLLDALGPEDTVAMVVQRLGVTELPDVVARLVRDRAGGHPFFSEELAVSLLESGTLQITDGICTVARTAGSLADLKLPDTVEGVVTSRIDRLEPAEQLALKVASAVGRVFPVRVLEAAFPLATSPGSLAGTLQDLERLDLTGQAHPDPDAAYQFKHLITQQVAYGLMLISQRQQIHRSVAEWFEATYAEDLAPYYPLLAHHWAKADDRERAMRYGDLAGAGALASGAYTEAAALLGQAADLDQALHPAAADAAARLRRGRRERQLAEALMGVGKMGESREHGEKAVALLGWPVPGSRAHLRRALVGQIAMQILHRVRPGTFARESVALADRALEMARAYERLGQLYYYANDSQALLHACVHGINLAERLPPSPELARLYANASVALSLAGVRPGARMYGEMALATADRAQQTSARGWVSEVCGLYRLGAGEWDGARALLDQAVSLFGQLGDQRHHDESVGLLAHLRYCKGEFAEAGALHDSLLASASRRGDAQLQALALGYSALCAIMLGKPEEAVATSEQALGYIDRAIGRLTEIIVYGAAALALARNGHLERAAAAAAQASERIAGAKPTAVYGRLGYEAAACACLIIRESAPAGPAAPALDRQLTALCAGLVDYARVFPIAVPAALRLQGRAHHVAKRSGAARRALARSLAAAVRLGMPVEADLARSALAAIDTV